MPSFTVRIFAGATVVEWDDPETVDAPSRLNPHPAHPHRYARVIPPDTLDVRATVGGVEAPLDGALGGQLFLWSWVETSGIPPSIVNPAGQSSKATIALTDGNLGHHALLVWRDGGGGVVLHFDVEA